MIPRKSELATLVLRHVHAFELRHAGGRDHTWCHVTERYWIPKGRRLISKMLHNCMICKWIRARPDRHRVPAAPLPFYRVPKAERKQPFSVTGMDAAGPFFVKHGRTSKAKRWLLVFTCGLTRAVHFELANSLDVDSFIMAFARFVGRRSCFPRVVISDNGGNFRKGEEVLRALVDDLNKHRNKLDERYDHIDWVFSPPYSPSMGGVFERIVQEAKKAITNVLPHVGLLNDEELNTAITVAEGILNNRPIAYRRNEADDIVPISPSHLLTTGRAHDMIPIGNITSLGRRWLLLQHALDDIWASLVKQMRPYLTQRDLPKQTRGSKLQPLKVGDVVVMLDRTKRGHWPRGRIQEIYPNSKDNQVRMCDVLCEGKIYRRSIATLMFLNGEEDKSTSSERRSE